MALHLSRTGPWRIVGLLIAVAGTLGLAYHPSPVPAVVCTLTSASPQLYSGFGKAVVSDSGNGANGRVIVGAPYEMGDTPAPSQGRVYVYSMNGELVFTLPTESPTWWFGTSLAVADSGGDARGWIIAGAPIDRVNNISANGRVYIFSKKSGDLLYSLTSPNAATTIQPFRGAFGWSVAAGDVDGDGEPDVIVSAPGEIAGPTIQGRVYAFSGASGALLYTLTSPNATGRTGEWAFNFGASVTAADLNGDGKADIVVAAPFQGRVYVFSGANGLLLYALTSPATDSAGFGASFAVAHFDGGTAASVVVGAPAQTVDGSAAQGAVYVFSGSNGDLLYSLTAPTRQPFARFGQSVAAVELHGHRGRGGLLAVGAPGVASGQGAAYIFAGPTGSLLYTLHSANPTPNGNFGSTLSAGPVRGGTAAAIAIAAPQEHLNLGMAEGAVYVFAPTGGVPGGCQP